MTYGPLSMRLEFKHPGEILKQTGKHPQARLVGILLIWQQSAVPSTVKFLAKKHR